MNLTSIAQCILDEKSTPSQLCSALDGFVAICSGISDIQPDPSFSAWAEDSMLPSGVAINPKAAAHCALDYRRTAVFIRGIYGAIKKLEDDHPDTTLEVLYAGCGPFATLVMPLLTVLPGEYLKLTLLDIHQQSLDSVELLLNQFGFDGLDIQLIEGDASDYRRAEPFHLIITETMQKSLEQEPQFAVTANLAPQLQKGGIFIPHSITVEFCLADLAEQRKLHDQAIENEATASTSGETSSHHRLATVLALSADDASDQLSGAQCHTSTGKVELAPTILDIPNLPNITSLEAALFTRICVFESYKLSDYESEITLPLKCQDIGPLAGGDRLRVSYQLGTYPKFNIERMPN